MPGYVDDPGAWMQAADVLVLASRHEGLGSVLIVALACGTQIDSTDCPSSPAEIIVNGRYGQLAQVDDVLVLAKALQLALGQSFYLEPATLAHRAVVFSPEHAANRYLELLTVNKTWS